MVDKKKKKASEPEVEPFESMMEKLEGLVHTLEAGDLPLEQSLEAYESGISLVRKAQSRLDGIDRRLEELLADGEMVSMEKPDGLMLEDEEEEEWEDEEEIEEDDLAY